MPIKFLTCGRILQTIYDISSCISLPPAELTKTASELSKKMEQLNAKSLEQSECIRRERMHIKDGDLFRVNHGNGIVMAIDVLLVQFEVRLT